MTAPTPKAKTSVMDVTVMATPACWVNVIKHFSVVKTLRGLFITAVIDGFRNKLECLSLASLVSLESSV